jgi:hypothetical protein
VIVEIHVYTEVLDWFHNNYYSEFGKKLPSTTLGVGEDNLLKFFVSAPT